MEHIKKAGRFGIHIKEYCQEHEELIRAGLESGTGTASLLALHALKISWLQHERLVHLIVVFIFAVLFMFSLGLYLVVLNPYSILLSILVLAVLGAYIHHYFILENKVQYWYTLYDQLSSQIEQ